MIYYKKNNLILEINDEVGNTLVTTASIGEVEEELVTADGTKTTYKTQGVITKEVKYITTITDLYTTEPKPTITATEKPDLVKKGDVVEWVVIPLTDAEIDEAIKNAYERIDNETNTAILAGFTFDGKTFSMSLSAQANWIFLLTEFNAGRFPDEWEVATKDDRDYTLTKDKAPLFFKACSVHKETVLKKGRIKKTAVNTKYGR